MNQLNIDLVRNSQCTLNELFDLYKEVFPTNQQWAEILTAREGILNFSSLKSILKKAINYYDTSKYVNSFYYQDKQYWINKDSRISLFRLIDSGANQITLQLNDNYLIISSNKLREFLNQLEIYAGKCFAVTAEHLQNMKQLNTIEELLNYDYTAKYPNKIILNENQH